MKRKKHSLKATRFALCGSLAALVAANGCMVGPNYQPPTTKMPAGYREAIAAPTTAPTIAPTTVPSLAAANAPAVGKKAGK